MRKAAKRTWSCRRVGAHDPTSGLKPIVSIYSLALPDQWWWHLSPEEALAH
jgi:hypothetical protein